MPDPRTRAILLTALVAVATACAAPATNPADAPPRAPTPDSPPAAVLQLRPYLGSVLVTVPVTIGDSTLPFLFDTGGGGTLVTPAAAAWAGCEPFGRVTGFRHDGEQVHAERCAPAEVVIDGWRAPARETGVFDLMSLLPDGVPPLGGIVALNTFEGLAITLELGAGRVIVESPGSLARRVASMTEVPYREGRQSGGLMLDPFLAVRAPQGPLWLELDSGNASSVLLAPHAARQLGLDLSRDEARPVTLHLEGYGPVEVMARQKEMIYDGLLNAALMKRLRITLDLRAKRAWLEEPSSG